jgi:hypothetical protein
MDRRASTVTEGGTLKCSVFDVNVCTNTFIVKLAMLLPDLVFSSCNSRGLLHIGELLDIATRGSVAAETRTKRRVMTALG